MPRKLLELGLLPNPPAVAGGGWLPPGGRGAFKGPARAWGGAGRCLVTGRRAAARAFCAPRARGNRGGMSEEDPQACAEPEEPKAGPPPEKTSDCYRVSEDLPARFNNPAWFRGYR